MTTPAIAIKNEIRELIDEQVKIFGQATPLTPSELEGCHCRAERIKLLGQELDRAGMTRISGRKSEAHILRDWDGAVFL